MGKYLYPNYLAIFSFFDVSVHQYKHNKYEIYAHKTHSFHFHQVALVASFTRKLQLLIPDTFRDAVT